MKKAAPQYQQSSPRKVDSSTVDIPRIVRYSPDEHINIAQMAYSARAGRQPRVVTGRKLRRLLMAQGYSKAEAQALAGTATEGKA